MEQQYIKGIPFCSLEYKRVIDVLKSWLSEKENKPKFIVTANQSSRGIIEMIKNMKSNIVV